MLVYLLDRDRTAWSGVDKLQYFLCDRKVQQFFFTLRNKQFTSYGHESERQSKSFCQLLNFRRALAAAAEKLGREDRYLIHTQQAGKGRVVGIALFEKRREHD